MTDIKSDMLDTIQTGQDFLGNLQVVSRLDKARFFKFLTALWLSKKGYSPNFEVEVGRYCERRADVVGVGCHSLIFVEVKSSKADFNTDKKWHEYLSMCDKFYFVSDRKVIEHIRSKIETLPYQDKVGLLEVDLETSSIKVVKPAKSLGKVGLFDFQQTLYRCIVAGCQFSRGKYIAQRTEVNSFQSEDYGTL